MDRLYQNCMFLYVYTDVCVRLCASIFYIMLEANISLRIPTLQLNYTWGQWRSFIQSSFYGRTFVAFSGRSMKNYITICFLLKSIEVSVDRTALHGTSAEASASNFQRIQTKNLSKYNCNIPACCVWTPFPNCISETSEWRVRNHSLPFLHSTPISSVFWRKGELVRRWARNVLFFWQSFSGRDKTMAWGDEISKIQYPLWRNDRMWPPFCLGIQYTYKSSLPRYCW